MSPTAKYEVIKRIVTRYRTAIKKYKIPILDEFYCGTDIVPAHTKNGLMSEKLLVTSALIILKFLIKEFLILKK